MKKTLLQKMTAFLNETIAYYSVDPIARRCFAGITAFTIQRRLGKRGFPKVVRLGAK